MAEPRPEHEGREKRGHLAMLARYFTFEGAALADIGCGDGGLVRSLAARGARVVGIDPTPAQIEKAQAAATVAGERYLEAGAQALPLEASSLDGAIFFNSLHHIPLELMDRALAEAARVVKPGGHIYVLEPIAEGAAHDLLAPIDDETFVRAKAEEALARAAQNPSLARIAREEYLGSWKVASVDALLEEMLRIDGGRRAAVETAEAAIRRDFEAAADEALPEGGFRFWLPYRVTVFRRQGSPAAP